MGRPGSGSRDEILRRVRKSVSSARSLFRGADARKVLPDLPTPVTSAVGEGRALAEMFGSKLVKLRGGYEVLEGIEQVPSAVERLIQQWKGETSSVLSWNMAELAVPGLEQRLLDGGIGLLVPEDLHREEERRPAAAVNVGLTGVAAAFAATGSMAFVPAPGRSRAAALLPLYHIALVPMSRLYPTVESWFHALREAGELTDLLLEAGQLAFVTGPSKSADIELNLTLGVHGPKAVHAVLYHD